jgi:drug/metabolite transporter (DMT)-like permease
MQGDYKMDKKKLFAEFGLLIVAASWGLNFSIMKLALADITPLFYLGIRFVIAAVFMGVIFNKKIKTIGKKELKAGLIVGIFLCASFSIQVIGLQYTTPGKSGFISNSSVVIVPFIYWFLMKKSPGITNILGAAVAFIGLGVLSLTSSFTIEWGDTLMFVSALLFAGQIVSVGKFASDIDPYVLAMLQIVVTGIGCIICAFIFEPIPKVAFSLNVWGAIVYGVIFGTMLAFILQSKAQQITTSSRTAIILCFEAVFAIFFALALGLETLSLKGIMGSALVFVGFIICEIDLDKGSKKSLNNNEVING